MDIAEVRIIWHACPIPRQHAAFDIAMIRRMWAVDRAGKIAVLHRIDMHIVHIDLKVVVVADGVVLQACHARNVARKKRSKFRENDPRISLHSIRATISKYMTSAGDALGYCVPGDALPGGKRGVGGGAVPK